MMECFWCGRDINRNRQFRSMAVHNDPRTKQRCPGSGSRIARRERPSWAAPWLRQEGVKRARPINNMGQIRRVIGDAFAEFFKGQCRNHNAWDCFDNQFDFEELEGGALEVRVRLTPRGVVLMAMKTRHVGPGEFAFEDFCGVQHPEYERLTCELPQHYGPHTVFHSTTGEPCTWWSDDRRFLYDTAAEPDIVPWSSEWKPELYAGNWHTWGHETPRVEDGHYLLHCVSCDRWVKSSDTEPCVAARHADETTPERGA